MTKSFLATFLINNQNRIAVVTLLILSCFVFFLHMGSFAVIMWDESRNAINALEMLQNHNYIVTYFEGKPDLWNTKPPLLIWLIVISMKIFGSTEFALRLPSALSGLATTFIIFFFIKNELKSTLAGLFSALILITTSGYICEHISRTGDYDATLILFTTSFILAFYKFMYADTEKTRGRSYWIFTICIILAVLTKSVAGLLMIPGALLYLVINKKVMLLINLRTLFSILLFILMVPGYYLLNEHFNPGYIKAFLENDFGRLSTTLSGHLHPFDFYWQNLIDKRLYPYNTIFVICLTAILFCKNLIIRRLTRYFLLPSIIYFLIISTSKTKLTWYDAQIFPILAMIMGMGIYTIYNFIFSGFKEYTISKKIICVVIFTTSIFIYPYKNIIKWVTTEPSETSWVQLRYGDFMKMIYKSHQGFNSYKIINRDYNPHLTFYTTTLKEKGVNTKVISENDPIQLGDTLLACIDDVKQKIEDKYQFLELAHDGACKLYIIKSVK
jgi:4-amino-4-deoxy-L-arabinose transferase-like glycosyltransferase